LERDEILALIQTDPEAIVTIIQTLEETVRRLENELLTLSGTHMNSRNSSRPHPPMGSNDPKRSVRRPVSGLVVKKGMKATLLSGVRTQTSSRRTVYLL